MFGEDAVRKVADLSKLRLTDEEVTRFSRQLGQVLGYIEKLNQLDTTKVEPLTHALDIPTPLRPDVVEASPGAETMLAIAPEHLHDSYKVPQVIGGGS